MSVWADATSSAVADVVAISQAHPWLPVTIEEPPQPRAEIQLAGMLLPAAAILPSKSAREPEHVRSVVATRPCGEREIAAYVDRRAVEKDIGGLLAKSIHEAPWEQLGVGRTAYYRECRKLIKEPPSTWRLVLLVAPYAGRGLSLERVALELTKDPRTIRSVVRDWLGVDGAFFRDTLGWEWVVELGLRRLRRPLRPVAAFDVAAGGVADVAGGDATSVRLPANLRPWHPSSLEPAR